jgi:hypothetical protein
MLRQPFDSVNQITQPDIRKPEKSREKDYNDNGNDCRIDDFSARRPGDLLHFQRDVMPKLANGPIPSERFRAQRLPILFFRYRRGSFARARCCHCHTSTPLDFSDARVKRENPECIRTQSRAGVSGFEPELSVLETDVLTVNTIPLYRRSLFDYFVSLCAVCLRQKRQNFLNSNRVVVFFLFLVVT